MCWGYGGEGALRVGWKDTVRDGWLCAVKEWCWKERVK